MIAALALRLGVGQWIVETALAGLLAAAGFGGLVWAHHHVYHKGELAQKARDDAAAKIESDRADAVRANLNKRIAAVQGELDAARTRVADLQRENDNEKAVSAQRQSDLLAGRERIRVLVRRTRPADPNGPAGAAPAAGVDPDAEVEVDLSGRSAAWIDGVRVEHNEAVRRLEACIVEYESLQRAVNEMP